MDLPSVDYLRHSRSRPVGRLGLVRLWLWLDNLPAAYVPGHRSREGQSPVHTRGGHGRCSASDWQEASRLQRRSWRSIRHRVHGDERDEGHHLGGRDGREGLCGDFGGRRLVLRASLARENPIASFRQDVLDASEADHDGGQSMCGRHGSHTVGPAAA